MEERQLYRDLSRMIRGELTSGEVKQLASREGFRTFSELCETHLPEDLGKVRLGTREILTRIDRYRRRAIDLYELWFWADELYNISFNHRIAYEARTEELVTSALSTISVIANERLFPNVLKTARSLEYIRACLLRRRKLQVRNIFMRIFEDMELANLANKHGGEEDEDAGVDPLGDDDDAVRWADVVLLDRPWRPGTDIYVDYNWMIAFTVTARSLFEEERAQDAAADEAEEPPCPEGEGRPARLRPTPHEGEEIDRVPALRRLVPNFDFERLKPSYFYDGDGIAEIVVEAARVGPAELQYATKLFCLANRIREARLDGGPVKTLVVRPGAGGARR